MLHHLNPSLNETPSGPSESSEPLASWPVCPSLGIRVPNSTGRAPHRFRCAFRASVAETSAVSTEKRAEAMAEDGAGNKIESCSYSEQLAASGTSNKHLSYQTGIDRLVQDCRRGARVCACEQAMPSEQNITAKKTRFPGAKTGMTHHKWQPALPWVRSFHVRIPGSSDSADCPCTVKFHPFTAILQTNSLQTKILRVEFPGEWPVFRGISPVQT